MRKEATNGRCPYIVLCFRSDGSDTVSSPVPKALNERRGDCVVVIYSESNKLDAISGRCLKILSLPQWHDIITRLEQSRSLSKDKKTDEMLRFLHANSCECDISTGTITIPQNLLERLEIVNDRAQLYLDEKGCYILPIPAAKMSERYSLHRLSEWFHEERVGTGEMMWSGKIRSLISDYDTAITYFLAVLGQAHPNAIQQYYRGIQAALCICSNNDDAESIDAIFRMCPGISREVYCPDAAPMLCAVRNSAVHAVDALLKNGVSIETCGGNSNTMLAYVLEYYSEKLIGKDFVWHLLDCQLGVDLGDLAYAFFTKDLGVFIEQLILRALEIGTLHLDDLDGATAELEETLRCPEAYNELAECLPEGKSYKIRELHEMLKRCLRQNHAQEPCVASVFSDKSEAARSVLQSKLLADVEELVQQLSPEVEYYHRAKAYYTDYFAPGKELHHIQHGKGVVLSNHKGILSVRLFTNAQKVELDVINEIVSEQFRVTDPAYQKHLFFDMSILRRGSNLEAVLDQAKARVALLQSRKLSHTHLNVLKQNDLRR